jgi:hypothetical protein
MTIIFDGTQGITTPAETANNSVTTPVVKSGSSLVFQTNGTTEAMRINTSGNVGIGTSTPGTTLNVFTGSTLEGLRIQRFAGAYYSELRHTDGPESLAFLVGDGSTVAERMRITGTGAVVLQGGTTTSNGVGISFPATQSASSNANTLDDYEEGTWTPSVGGTTTYTTRYGFYTKIGNIVTIQFRIHVSTFQDDSSRSTIYGLPFPMDGTSTKEQTGGIGFWQNLYQSPTFLSMRGDPQQSYLIITGITSASASLSDGLGVMGNNANLYGYSTYRVY